MPEPLTPALARIRQLVLDDDRLVRAIATGRRRGERAPWRRVELRYVDLKHGRHLQVTTYDATQAYTHNVDRDDAAAAVDDFLKEPFGNWHVDTVEQTVQLRVTKKGKAQVHTRAAEHAAPPAEGSRTRHDRVKQRVLDPTDPFLATLGMTTDRGAIKASRRGKYRQIEEFLRLAAPMVDDAVAARHLPTPTPHQPLRVVDLGCGNAYLTFAAYRLLAQVRELPLDVTGVDAKTAARERNTRLAAELGISDAVRFIQGDITTADVDPLPDVVLALHACDTATDDALARAVRWQARVVLAAPCCHHDLQSQLRQSTAPAPYGLLTRTGILRERLADVLTDALRATVLRLLGYRVDVVEFVESAHTPRNVLLRATRTQARPSAELVREYRELVTAWGVTPALQLRLEDQLRRVLAS